MSDKESSSNRFTGAQRRDIIIAEATAAFHRLGYHSSSLEDVALASGIQKASLYYHFSSKEDLLLHIIQNAMAPFKESLQRIQESKASPRVKLRKAIEDHVLILCQNLDAVSVLQHEFRHLTEEAQQDFIRERDEYDQFLEQLIRDGVEQDIFRKVDVKMAAYSILGMLNWLYRWYTVDGRLAPPEIATQMAEFALAGLEKHSDD
jgi:AcrR family transcriptional regulator